MHRTCNQHCPPKTCTQYGPGARPSPTWVRPGSNRFRPMARRAQPNAHDGRYVALPARDIFGQLAKAGLPARPVHQAASAGGGMAEIPAIGHVACMVLRHIRQRRIQRKRGQPRSAPRIVDMGEMHLDLCQRDRLAGKGRRRKQAKTKNNRPHIQCIAGQTYSASPNLAPRT